MAVVGLYDASRGNKTTQDVPGSRDDLNAVIWGTPRTSSLSVSFGRTSSLGEHGDNPLIFVHSVLHR